MKKFYSIVAIVAATISANAQTPLNTNGSLEDWTDGAVQPTGWFISESLLANGSVAKVSTGAQDGNNFVKIVSPESSYNSAGLADITLDENATTFTIEYWYKELNNGNVRFRHWGQWRNDSGAVNPDGADEFQPSAYVMDTNGEWTHVVATSTKPAGANLLRFSFRAYPQNNLAGGEIGIDNVILYAGTASLAENNIEGLNVFPNPANDIVTISSFSLDTKKVQLFDMVGKKVLDVETTSTINVSELNKGIYVMKITEAGKTATRKLVVK